MMLTLQDLIGNKGALNGFTVAVESGFSNALASIAQDNAKHTGASCASVIDQSEEIECFDLEIKPAYDVDSIASYDAIRIDL